MSAVAVNYCRVEPGSFQEITADQISIADPTIITSDNLQDALNSIVGTIDWRRNEDGVLAPYSGDVEIVDAGWATNAVMTSTSADITFHTGDGETTTIKELKDEIQFLKDEINNLKMLLLEN